MKFMCNILFMLSALLVLGTQSVFSADNGRVEPSLQAVLFDAIKNNEVNAVIDIITKNPDLKNRLTPSGLAPLHTAVGLDRPEIMQFLLDQKADSNIEETQSGRHLTPLCLAMQPSRKHLIEPLLAAGATPTACCFRIAASNNMPDTIAQLAQISREEINKNSDESQNFTPLHFAVVKRHAACVSALLNAGADPNIPNVVGFVPLYYAVNPNADEDNILDSLLAAHANPDQNCFTNAITNSRPDITLKLLQSPAFQKDVLNKTDLWGFTPLSQAVKIENKTHTQLLVDAEANPFTLEPAGANGIRKSAWLYNNKRNNADMSALLLTHHRLPKTEPVYATTSPLASLQFSAKELAHRFNPTAFQLLQQRKLAQEATHKAHTMASRIFHSFPGKFPPNVQERIRQHLGHPAQEWRNFIGLPVAERQPTLTRWQNLASHSIFRRIKDKWQLFTAQHETLNNVIWKIRLMRKECAFYAQQKNLSWSQQVLYRLYSFYGSTVMAPVTYSTGLFTELTVMPLIRKFFRH